MSHGIDFQSPTRERGRLRDGTIFWFCRWHLGGRIEPQEPWEGLGSVFWGDLMTLSVGSDT